MASRPYTEADRKAKRLLVKKLMAEKQREAEDGAPVSAKPKRKKA